MNSTLNRRNWLKQSAGFTGSLMAGLALGNELVAKPAFGMMPLYPKALVEYDPASLQNPPLIKARLSANENPFGPSKKAIAAIAESAAKGSRYPKDATARLVEVLAAREGVAKENILIAPGSSDILEKTAFALCMKGGNVISADPSYMSLIKSATAIGAKWKNIPLRADYAHDLDAMERAVDDETRLVYVCNPNNPTGTVTPGVELKDFCKRVSAKVPVFIDEAYLEFLDDQAAQTTVGLINEGYDLVVCRTFSKVHGMAGLRLGYMVAKPERVKLMQNITRMEMGISITTIEGAIASLADKEFQNYTRTNIKINRDYTMMELKKANLQPLPSFTNFILFPIEMPTRILVDAMMEKGVGMRGFEINGKPYGRVSIGTMDEMKLFTKSLVETIS